MVLGTSGAAVQDLFATLADRWSPALRVAGVIAEGHGLADRVCRAGYLRRICSEERFAIFDDRAPRSEACHIEERGVEAAAKAVLRDMEAGCDLVLLSKFGKLEAAGKGLWSAFSVAAEARIPILTSVSPTVAKAWETFAGTGFTVLPADPVAIDAWVVAVSRVPHQA